MKITSEAEFQSFMESLPSHYGLRSAIVLFSGVHLEDSIRLSVQASEFHYCTPRVTDHRGYTAWEVGFPSVPIDALKPYAEDAEDYTQTVYGYVPTSVLLDIFMAADDVESYEGTPNGA